MWAIERLSGAGRRVRRQSGATAVEVSFCAIVFFTIVFATLELARYIYVVNTLQEVTRRAASELVRTAPAAPDSPSILQVRRRAIFNGSGDNLWFADPVDVDHIRIDYLSLLRASDGEMTRTPTASLPSCGSANRRICMANPNDPGCVRFVRVRICDPATSGDCVQARYKVSFPLVTLDVPLPRSTTIATVESFGYIPNTPGVCL